MTLLAFLFLAASTLHFEVTDGRGKKPSGVTIEASDPDAEGWYRLAAVSKGKSNYVVVWPVDARAKTPDGPGAVPVVVADTNGAQTPRIAGYRCAAHLLGIASSECAAIEASTDPLLEGVRLLNEKRASDAIEPLSRALKDRERQLTRVPSEIYAAAMVYSQALFDAGKFDDAAVAARKALAQRPSDLAARKLRNKALVKAGKPEAVQ
jgi:tetratricopeptide (TPR) repeat protein